MRPRLALAKRRLAAAATAAAGVLTISSALGDDVPWRRAIVGAVEPRTAHTIAHAIAVVGGLALLGLAMGILHGRRRATHAVVPALLVVAAVHAAKGLDYEEASLAIALAVALRALFGAVTRGSEPSVGVVAAVAAVGALTAAYAILVTTQLVDPHAPHLEHALSRAWSAAAQGAPARWVTSPGLLSAHVLIALGLVSAAVAVRHLLAPARAVDGHDAAEHHAAAALVARHGEDSLAPFVLRADKAFFFAHGGVLAYRVLRETAIVSGDPVAPPGAAPAVLGAFLEHARARGWDVVLTGAGDAHLTGYAALGLRTLQIGAEAVVDPATFSLEGRAIRKVRQSVHRVQRRGWAIEIVDATALTAETAAELAATEHGWRASAPRRAGFAMAMDRLWGAPEDVNDVYVLARRPDDGGIGAFLRFVPYRRGLSLDAMRRFGDEPNGLIEAMVVAGLELARERGCPEVSLNFAGFAHVMAADALAGRSQRALRWVLHRMHGRFQLERLVRFNDKFGPTWRARHLVCTAHARLPITALRVLQAESYLRPPPERPRLGAWRPLPTPVGTGVAAAGTQR